MVSGVWARTTRWLEGDGSWRRLEVTSLVLIAAVGLLSVADPLWANQATFALFSSEIADGDVLREARVQRGHGREARHAVVAVDHVGLAAAIRHDDGALMIDHQALRETLVSMSPVQGMTGTLACDAYGDCGSQAIAIVLHTDPTDPEAGMRNAVGRFSR